MGKYIDAEKLYEYLEQVNECYPRYADNVVDNAVSNVIGGIKTFITSLQQEQPEMDLEEETNRWWKEHLHLNPENKLWMDAHQSVVFARHFFELGRNARKEE